MTARTDRSTPAATPAMAAAPNPSMPPGEVRALIRAGAYGGLTTGLAPGRLQGNLVILPADLAGDFERFCRANPRPCPLIGMSEAGDPRVPALGDIDLRSDLPRYRVWRDGALVSEPADIGDLWRDDLVGFVIGCSFTFEEALAAEGIELRNITEGVNVPMYKTSIETTPAGAFRGPLVVSMRPFAPPDAGRAATITSRFTHAHGAPVHSGDPAAIGIAALDAPDYGDVVTVRPGEIPVFWACGVTPQAALAAACPPLCITHAPGHMLITDRLGSEAVAA